VDRTQPIVAAELGEGFLGRVDMAGHGAPP
jgi:hypothetical protein